MVNECFWTQNSIEIQINRWSFATVACFLLLPLSMILLMGRAKTEKERNTPQKRMLRNFKCHGKAKKNDWPRGKCGKWRKNPPILAGTDCEVVFSFLSWPQWEGCFAKIRNNRNNIQHHIPFGIYSIFIYIPKNLNEANEWTNEWNEQERKYWKNAVSFAYHNAVIIYKWSSEHGAYHFKWYQVTNAYANLELYRVSHSSHRIVRSTAICSGSRYI